MTGTDVRKMREAFGWRVPILAQLVGVDRTTAYRWEQGRGKALRLDPLHDALLTRLLELASRPRRAERGRALAQAVKLGGTLAGLAELLADLRILP